MSICPKCGQEGPHYAPPSFHEDGFYICERFETMTPHFQSITHDEAAGTYGDCFRACVASILDIEDMLTVPHFFDQCNTTEECNSALVRFNEWLEDRGLQYMELAPAIEWDSIPWLNSALHFAIGPTERGTSHCVVMRGKDLEHDPHVSQVGLEGVTCRGFFFARLENFKCAECGKRTSSPWWDAGYSFCGRACMEEAFRKMRDMEARKEPPSDAMCDCGHRYHEHGVDQCFAYHPSITGPSKCKCRRFCNIQDEED